MKRKICYMLGLFTLLTIFEEWYTDPDCQEMLHSRLAAAHKLMGG